MHMTVLALAALLAQATPMPSAAPPGTTAATPAPNAQGAPGVAVPARSAALSAANQPSFSDLMASLNNIRSEISKVQSMNGTSANNIQPVNVAQLSGSNPAALNGAVARDQSQLNQLRNALGRVTVTTPTNERITVAQFLADNKMTLTQIVGADVKNGKLVLFYQKP